MKYDTQTPFIAAYLIFRKGNNVAMVLRQNTPWMNNHYALPAGKAEKEEGLIACALREAKEETGATVQAKDLKPVLTVHRHNDDTDWIDLVFEVSKWKGELYNAEPHVHGELKWFDISKLPKNVVPNSRFMVEQVVAGKTYAELGWEETDA